MPAACVDQNYLRGDTINAATARMVDAQGEIPLAQAWGGGEVASADGLRFVVPVRTLDAGPDPRHFGPGQWVTYLNFLSDQFAGFHAIVVPGTLRDSLHILDELLEQQTSLTPTELMTDTAGYSDQVFGLFRLLGYQFSPGWPTSAPRFRHWLSPILAYHPQRRLRLAQRPGPPPNQH